MEQETADCLTIVLNILFAVTLSVIMLASYHEIRQQSSEMLERYVEFYTPDQQSEPEKAPDVKPGNQVFPGPGPKQGGLPPDLGPGFQLSTFYSVAFSEDGTVLSVNDGASNGIITQAEYDALSEAIAE